MKFSDYIKDLAEKHRSVLHSDSECHFSDLNEDAQTGYSHMRMHYPCVVIEEMESTFSGGTDMVTENDQHIILFLDHVRDTANTSEVNTAFDSMKTIARDFLKRMHRELKRFDLSSVSMERVYLKDSGLYGYAVQLEISELFVDLDCNNAFTS